MQALEFMAYPSKLRKAHPDFDEFQSIMKKEAAFQKIVSNCLIRTNNWGKSVGLIKEDEQKPSLKRLTDDEIVWKKFWDSHAFHSFEDTRNMMDMISIITGIDQTKFLKVKKVTKGTFFPEYLCIIPKGNTGSHSYTIGDPIIRYGGGPRTFVKKDSSIGNNMDTDLSSISLPSREDIEALFCSIFFHTPYVEDYVIGLLSSFTEEEI